MVTDEVYEHLVLDGPDAVARADRDAARAWRERTLTISSAGKTFSFTGWKIGWVTGPEHLVTAVRTVKQFLTYVSGAPFQPAVAFALRDPGVAAWVVELAASLSRPARPAVRRARGRRASPSSGRRAPTSCSPTRRRSGTTTAPRCAATCPRSPASSACPSRRSRTPAPTSTPALRSWVRFTFVKRDEVLTQAVAGLHRLHRA